MAIANFFDKAALSAASLLRGIKVDAIRERLLQHVIAVSFDKSVAHSPEAHYTLELLINLLARLYPQIAIIAPLIDGDSEGTCDLATCADLARALYKHATDINPRIDLSYVADHATVRVVIGNTSPPDMDRPEIPTLYVGSSGWDARLSADAPVGSGSSGNPFGAGAAACLAAAAVFRTVFAAELQISISGGGAKGRASDPPEDTPSAWTNLSLLELSVSANSGSNRTSEIATETTIDIGETVLVGAGAIGEAVVWALARVPMLIGRLQVVDGETVELSNLQRYPLATQDSVDEQKVRVAERAVARVGETSGANGIAVVGHPSMWGPFVAARGDYAFDRILLALDSAEDRMEVQASLPRWIANAWTQPENLGVSRHEFVGDRPCVCCLYLPTGPRKSKDAVYAEALRCTTQAELMEVRTLLHNGKPIGRDFIVRAAARLGVPADDLLPFANQSLDRFYVSALCAGLVLRLGGQLGVGQPAEVPMAFQSALAGILLAAELVTNAGGLRPSPMPARTEIDLVRMDFLSPRGLRINSPMTKNPAGRCICQDPDFRERFLKKWQLEVA